MLQTTIIHVGFSEDEPRSKAMSEEEIESRDRAMLELISALEHELGMRSQPAEIPSEVPAKSGWAVAAAFAGVAVGAVGQIVSALTYWQAQQPRRTLTVKRGDSTITFENLSKKEVADLLRPGDPLHILVSADEA